MAHENAGSYSSDKTNGQMSHSTVGEKVGKVAQGAECKTDSVLSSVGGGLSSLGATISENIPDQGTFASAAGGVADGLKSGGEYLSAHGIGDIAKDLTDVIRKYPIASMWVGMGVGVLVGRSISQK